MTISRFFKMAFVRHLEFLKLLNFKCGLGTDSSMLHLAKFRADRSSRCCNTAIFHFFKWRPSVNLGFVIRVFGSHTKRILLVFVTVQNWFAWGSSTTATRKNTSVCVHCSYTTLENVVTAIYWLKIANFNLSRDPFLKFTVILPYLVLSGAHCVNVVDKAITPNLRLLHVCLVVNACRGIARRPRYKYSITARWKLCSRFINSGLNAQYLPSYRLIC